MDLPKSLIKILKNLDGAISNIKRVFRIGEPEGIYSRFWGSSIYRNVSEPTFTVTRKPLYIEDVKGLHDLVHTDDDAIEVIRAAIRDTFYSPIPNNNSYFWVSKYVKPNTGNDSSENDLELVDTRVLDISNELFNRKINGDYVVGGKKLALAVKQSLSWGDCFIFKEIESISNGYTLRNLVYLPPLEMVVVKDDYGEITHYEQRRYLGDPDGIRYETHQIIHVSYDKEIVYGKPIFTTAAIKAFKEKNKILYEHLPQKSQADSFDPTIVKVPKNTSQDQRDELEKLWYEKKSLGKDDLFITPENTEYLKLRGGKSSSGVGFQEKYLDRLRQIIIPAGFPTWYFQGFDNTGATDIASQPAANYERLRGDFCAIVAQVVIDALNTEILFQLGPEQYNKISEKGYTLMFHPIIVNPNMASEIDRNRVDDETGNENNQDTEVDELNEKYLTFNSNNSNGKH